MLFPPLFTIVLNWPPVEWPNSALNWFCRSENSCVASVGTYKSGPVIVLLLLSKPSIMKSLFVGSLPPFEGPVPLPILHFFVIPALLFVCLYHRKVCQL